jgi:bifunctional non-homologous end joining protein LigD
VNCRNSLGNHPERIYFYAFDLMYLDGFDLRGAKLIDRKSELLCILKDVVPGRFLYSEHLETDPQEMYARACKIGIEGIVSKLGDSPYRSDHNSSWVKAICRQRDTFAVVGFEPGPNGSLKGGYLGGAEGKALVYRGKVETGFSGDAARALRARLEALRVPKSPLTVAVKKPKAVWVKPEVLVDVEYRAVTSAGKLIRHGSFKGIREDLVSPKGKERRK